MNKLFKRIYIEITNKCNLNCSFCSMDDLPKKEMSVNEFRIVISKIKNYTNEIYLHIKGEPLLYSNLDDILSICDDNKMIVNITTNATLLKSKLNILLKHKIKRINISLHAEQKINNYFNDVFESCDILSKHTIIIYRIWIQNKLSTKIVDNILKYYHLSTEIVDKIKNESNIKIRNNIYLDKDIEFNWPKINNINNKIGTCYGTRTHIGILSNGTIIPCCLDSNGVIVLGNIFKDNLEDVINSNLFQDIKKGFQNNKVICGLCQSCTYRYRFIKDKTLPK